jgi:hypothetical protein
MMAVSFVMAKATLSKATWLGQLDPTAQLALHLDASSSHIGAALNQRPKGHSTWQPLSFFSHRLEAAQAKWSVFELLTCLEGIRHFWFILQGRAFTIYTDHKPLVGLCHGSLTHGRQGSAATWPTWMSLQWTSGTSGPENMAADAMSRPPISFPDTLPSSFAAVVADQHRIAARQLSCPSTLQAGGSPSLQVL